MIEILLANWKYIAIAVLSASLGMTWHLYRATAHDLSEYRAEVRAQGMIAASAAKAQEAHQNQVVEDVSNAWNAQIEPTRRAAVAAYIARNRRADLHAPVDGVLYRPGSSSMPAIADYPEISDGISQECLPPPGLLEDCAEDALKVRAWQSWGYENEFPVK